MRGLWEASHAFSTSTCLERTRRNAFWKKRLESTRQAQRETRKATPSMQHTKWKDGYVLMFIPQRSLHFGIFKIGCNIILVALPRKK